MLSIDFGQDVPLVRSVTKFGEKLAVPQQPVFATWSLDDPTPDTAQGGRLYCYRGTDVRDGDTVVLPIGRNDDGTVRGVNFTVVGDPKWDHRNPLDGNDFGIIKFAIVRGG